MRILPVLLQRALRRTRQLLVRGTLLILPLAFTIWVMLLLFGFANRTVSALVTAVLRVSGVPGLEAWWWDLLLPGLGLMVSLGILAAIGFLGTNLVGKRLLAGVERLLLSIPFVRGVYGAAKQLMEAITSGGKGAFREVVALEYPRRGVWVLGFLTSSMSPGRNAGPWTEEMVNVFVPTSPNPTSGFLLILSAREVHRLPIAVDEGIKMIVSGGLVLPPGLVSPPPRPLPPEPLPPR